MPYFFPENKSVLTHTLKRCATQNPVAFQLQITRLQNYQIPYHSPAFTSFLILRLMRSRFSALMCEMYSLPFK